MCNFLFIFVEGGHDELFFNKIRDIICYNQEYKYDIRIVKYQEKGNKRKIDKLIKECKTKENYGYFFISDLDSRFHTCFTSKKKYLQDKYKPLEEDKVIIAKEEIESWYFSGNKLDGFRKNGINLSYECSKEEFDEFITSKFDSKINFDLNLAFTNNESFSYFIKRLMKMGLDVLK
ncbi:MAG: hypothetical protein LBC39_07695 [Methanobrevibacter sp.]|jgi:hypothetical protein|nr:hypothetical protein [Candidatus Methanovirga aequatorialis]